MIPALLMIAAVAVPSAPPVTATAVSHGCNDSAIVMQVNYPAELTFGGDLGAMPPMGVRSGTAEVRIPGPVGRTVVWSIEDYRTGVTYAEGVHIVPPCISAPAPVRPTVVTVVDPPPTEIGTSVRVTRKRFDLWNWTLRRFGGAW